MTSQVQTTGTIAADGSEVLSFTVDRPVHRIDAILVERTAGDSTTYDVEVSTDSSFSDETQELPGMQGASFDPTNDPAVLQNSGHGAPFDPAADSHQVHVRVTANGGTAGGNTFRVRIHFNTDKVRRK